MTLATEELSHSHSRHTSPLGRERTSIGSESHAGTNSSKCWSELRRLASRPSRRRSLAESNRYCEDSYRCRLGLFKNSPVDDSTVISRRTKIAVVSIYVKSRQFDLSLIDHSLGGLGSGGAGPTRGPGGPLGVVSLACVATPWMRSFSNSASWAHGVPGWASIQRV